MVGTFLKLAGYEVLTAKDTAEALQHAETPGLGAFILDVNLGTESSAELLTSLRTKRPEVPVILYTGLENSEESVKKMLGSGSVHYFRKGNLQALVVFVNSLIEQSGKTGAAAPSGVVTGGWNIV